MASDANQNSILTSISLWAFCMEKIEWIVPNSLEKMKILFEKTEQSKFSIVPSLVE